MPQLMGAAPTLHQLQQAPRALRESLSDRQGVPLSRACHPAGNGPGLRFCKSGLLHLEKTGSL